MPFIFGEDEDEVREEGEEEGTAAGPLRPVRGRRTFNDRGEEVLGNEVRAYTHSRKAETSPAACHASDRARRSPTMNGTS